MENPLYNRISRIVSILLHPLVIPVLAMLLLLFGPTLISSVTIQIKLFLASIVLLNTMVLPIISIALLRWFGVLPDWSIQSQKQRIMPLGIVAVCYGMGIGLLSSIGIAFLLNRFLIAGLCCVVAAFVINLFWKISLHMIAYGGLLGMLFVLCYAGFNFQYYLIAGILMGGLLASARLQLGSHTISQILTGFLLGNMISILVILFF